MFGKINSHALLSANQNLMGLSRASLSVANNNNSIPPIAKTSHSNNSALSSIKGTESAINLQHTQHTAPPSSVISPRSVDKIPLLAETAPSMVIQHDEQLQQQTAESVSKHSLPASSSSSSSYFDSDESSAEEHNFVHRNIAPITAANTAVVQSRDDAFLPSKRVSDAEKQPERTVTSDIVTPAVLPQKKPFEFAVHSDSESEIESEGSNDFDKESNSFDDSSSQSSPVRNAGLNKFSASTLNTMSAAKINSVPNVVIKPAVDNKEKKMSMDFGFNSNDNSTISEDTEGTSDNHGELFGFSSTKEKNITVDQKTRANLGAGAGLFTAATESLLSRSNTFSRNPNLNLQPSLLPEKKLSGTSYFSDSSKSRTTFDQNFADNLVKPHLNQQNIDKNRVTIQEKPKSSIYSPGNDEESDSGSYFDSSERTSQKDKHTESPSHFTDDSTLDLPGI
eukprot:GDKK01072673.1.p1 GENE.GDKK01072673.1~~GDKK01072673.1.p1  ORF type:complete len:517 (+),score=130.77 GDKK01072673.1:201-1553(+)